MHLVSCKHGVGIAPLMRKVRLTLTVSRRRENKITLVCNVALGVRCSVKCCSPPVLTQWSTLIFFVVGRPREFFPPPIIKACTSSAPLALILHYD